MAAEIVCLSGTAMLAGRTSGGVVALQTLPVQWLQPCSPTERHGSLPSWRRNATPQCRAGAVLAHGRLYCAGLAHAMLLASGCAYLWGCRCVADPACAVTPAVQPLRGKEAPSRVHKRQVQLLLQDTDRCS
jgi:hypothetical protein